MEITFTPEGSATHEEEPAFTVPILSRHLAEADRIVLFLTDLGWEVKALTIEREDNEDGEGWKAHEWYLFLSCAPRQLDRRTVPAPSNRSSP